MSFHWAFRGRNRHLVWNARSYIPENVRHVKDDWKSLNIDNWERVKASHVSIKSILSIVSDMRLILHDRCSQIL